MVKDMDKHAVFEKNMACFLYIFLMAEQFSGFV